MEQLITTFGQYGLPGLSVLGLAYAVKKLFDSYVDVQNKRIDEARQTIEVIRANTVSQDNNTAAIKALGELIKAQRGTGT